MYDPFFTTSRNIFHFLLLAKWPSTIRLTALSTDSSALIQHCSGHSPLLPWYPEDFDLLSLEASEGGGTLMGFHILNAVAHCAWWTRRWLNIPWHLHPTKKRHFFPLFPAKMTCWASLTYRLANCLMAGTPDYTRSCATYPFPHHFLLSLLW